MPKQLVLMRHAKSDWSVSGQKDFDRELNFRGHRDAPKMGARMKLEKGFVPDLVVSSPAVRAKLTAQYVCEQLPYEEDRIMWEDDIYEASVRTLLRVVNNLEDSCEKVLIFGHNPGLSYFIEYLTKETVGDIPTAAVANIVFEFDTWKAVSEATGKLHWYIYPKEGEN